MNSQPQQPGMEIVKVPHHTLSEPFNTILQDALDEDATDIHIHSLDNEVAVRFRVDGMVHEKLRLPAEEGKRLINQIKVASRVQISRVFAPLESQIQWQHDGLKKDIRVTIIPIETKESAHLRILSARQRKWDIENLGFADDDQQTITQTVRNSHGLILVSGRTGSGKTTTMYTLASLLDTKNNIVFSIEDPVEFRLPYVQQIEVDAKHNLTMNQGLRTLLRTDPDVILVGEIRDQESAVVAAQAALSGRLVIATVHAKDATNAIEAMHYLSVPSYIIGGSLRLVIAQSLARRICPSCATFRAPHVEEQQLFESVELPVPQNIMQPLGCDRCSKYGYLGRIGIFETVHINDKTAEGIALGLHHQDLRKHLRQSGIRSMMTDALKKVTDRVTSMDEVFRICWNLSEEDKQLKTPLPPQLLTESVEE